MTTFFRPGAGLGIVGVSTLGLFQLADDDLAFRVWELVEEGAGIDTALEVLSGRGLRGLGSFVLAAYEGADLRVVVRGTAAAFINRGIEEEVVPSGNTRTWTERVMASPQVVTLHLDDVSQAPVSFRVSTGVVPAVTLLRGSRTTPPDRLLPDERDAIGLLPVNEEIKATQNRTRVAPPVPTRPPDSEHQLHPVAVGVDPAQTLSAREFLESSDQSGADDDGSSVVLNPAVPAGSDAESGSTERNEFDEIWGRTVARSVHTAAVHVPAERPDDQPEADPIEARSGQGMALPEPAPRASTPLIEAVPAVNPPGFGDHDGRTMTKAQLQALRATGAIGHAPVTVASPVSGPTVQAVMCPASHANPPQRPTCRACGLALSGAPVLIARPSLATLRFSDGTSLELDRPSLVGRNPRLEGTVSNELPKLHSLGAAQGVSRTHALFRLEGWQVMVEDLNSANGTVVTLPGREPRRLHPAEPLHLEDGASIDFGGDVTCTVTM